ncbi:hypothetical protein FRC06_008851, partial [Ceratobasidium sp. 370]
MTNTSEPDLIAPPTAADQVSAPPSTPAETGSLQARSLMDGQPPHPSDQMHAVARITSLCVVA